MVETMANVAAYKCYVLSSLCAWEHGYWYEISPNSTVVSKGQHPARETYSLIDVFNYLVHDIPLETLATKGIYLYAKSGADTWSKFATSVSGSTTKECSRFISTSYYFVH